MADIGSDRRRQRRSGQLVRNPLRQRTGAGAANSIHLDRYAAGRIKFHPTADREAPAASQPHEPPKAPFSIQRSHAAATPSTVPAGSRRYRAVQRPALWQRVRCHLGSGGRTRPVVPESASAKTLNRATRSRCRSPQQQRVNRRPGRVAANAAPPTRPTVRHWVPPPPCSLLASVLEPDHRYARTVTQRGGRRRRRAATAVSNQSHRKNSPRDRNGHHLWKHARVGEPALQVSASAAVTVAWLK